MLGLSPSDVGRPIDEVLAGRPQLAGFLHAEGKVRAEISQETPKPLCLAVHSSPLGNPQRQAAGRLVIVRDISEGKRAEEERLEMERRLLHAQKLESLGVLTGGIAHDFNNLLTAMLGNMELALLDLPADSPARPSIVQATRSVHRAAGLVRLMLAYAGKGSMVPAPLQLSEQIGAMEPLLRTSIAKNVTLELNLAHDLPFVLVDPCQVEQVALNLVINASEAIGDQPGTIHLSTGLLECDKAYLAESCIEEKPPAGRFVHIEISDTGCGMDEETQQRLFEPFFSSKFAGRGLGMSAVLGIVRAHQGAILLQSEPGQGTVIRVLFPVARDG